MSDVIKSEDKPIVHFVGEPRFIVAPYPKEDGGEWTYARVYGLDHPILGRDSIRTSEVLKINDDGSFETRNTRYVPFRGNDQ